ncbi:MAG TPA: xanthine dehydrogenase family protein molybdopterin-binding subunit [Clostridia bacterium]|nr:xanthine dehydrogenase family protein molybdopterin-binding subunit [Clostridia bacterium]
MVYKSQIGTSVTRKDAWDKVTGTAKYTSDIHFKESLHARVLTSPFAHASIKKIDTTKAEASKGVRAVITGGFSGVLVGSMITDRPPIARDKVRYFGEVVAVVVADKEDEAQKAVNLIEVEYEPLPVVNSIKDAIKENATLVHENFESYGIPSKEVHQIANSNICNHVKIRKGNMENAWKISDVIVEYEFSMPQSDHLAMETRNTKCQIAPDGTVNIYTSTQAPFGVKEQISTDYNIPEGKVVVHTPLVGGGFGGKASASVEFLAYLASLAVDGKMVTIANTREEDISTSPSKLAAEGKVKLGATKDGKLTGLECTYYINCGAYANTGPNMARAAATDCSGPYNIDSIFCDSYCVYTNHTYATSFRGFGHSASTFGIEMAMHKLGKELGMDPLELRKINAIREGDLSPTQSLMTLSNTGDLGKCIDNLKNIMNWDEGNKINTDKGTIITKGVSCLWKSSSSPTDASSGAVLIFNKDGTINANFGVTEIGPGMKTTIGQIIAEKMKMDINDIHVFMDVDTRITPKHWKTVASMSTFMVGNAAVDACEDLIRQIKEVAAIVLRCPAEDIEIENRRAFMKDDTNQFLEFKDLAHGFKYKEGPSIHGELIGRGNYIMKHLLPLDFDTGKGKAGVSWTVGAQGVEIEYNPKIHTYRLLKAVTVIDAGKVINPGMAKGVVMGGMSMGLGLATREEFVYNENAILEDTSIRTYKVMHFGEQPEYIVDFVETPQMDGPFGAKGIGEHGILGIPAAFTDAIQLATGKEFHNVPILPELIWKTVTGGQK